ncbi:hypothetical protein AURDEDRAFT_138345 [Auricularia subglabra TFB-10046 SS5]|nr:hypothetical protein AURDEDRAFT_138345 [Auricularia subglabra TFB-10046 SS5]
MAEWTPGVYDLAPSAIFGEDFLTCDYCAADIFVSYFECRACGKEDGVALCPLCYASGRTCRCVGGMKPCVTESFSEIVKKRNDCARVLSELGVPTPEMSDRRIERARAHVLKTFDAACAIHRKRPASELYLCRLGERAHQVAAPDTVAYDSEDGPTFGCFMHLLAAQAMHSARAAHMSAEAVAAGPNGEDNVGNYLSAVVRKYRQPGCLDLSITRAGWYDTPGAGGDLEDTAALAQEDIAALIADDIRPIVQSARKSCTETVSGYTLAPSLEPREHSPAPSCSTHVASTVVESPPAHSPPHPPSPATTLASQVPAGVAEPDSSPLSSPSPPKPAASSSAPVVKKKPTNSTKRNPIVVASDDDESDAYVPAPVKKAPTQKRITSGAKRARSNAAEAAAPTSKRRKVADPPSHEVKPASYAELMAQAMGKAHNHNPAARPSTIAESAMHRVRRASVSSASLSSASTSSSATRVPPATAQLVARPPTTTAGSSPSTAHSTPPPPYSNGATPGARSPAAHPVQAAQSPANVAVDVPAAGAPAPDGLALVLAQRPRAPSKQPTPPPPAAAPAARVRTPLPKFKKKRPSEDDATTSSSSDVRPFKQPRLLAPPLPAPVEDAQRASQLESVLNSAFEKLGQALVQKGEHDERLSRLLETMKTAQTSDGQQRERCVELEARCLSLEEQLQATRDDLGAQLQAEKDQLAFAQQDYKKLATELQSTREDFEAQLQEARATRDGLQLDNAKLMDQMVKLKAELMQKSNESTNPAPAQAVVRVEQSVMLPPQHATPPKMLHQQAQLQQQDQIPGPQQWNAHHGPRQYFHNKPWPYEQNVPYQRYQDRRMPVNSPQAGAASHSGEQSRWQQGIANRGRDANVVADTRGVPFVRRDTRAGAHAGTFGHPYKSSTWSNRRLERRVWPEQQQGSPMCPSSPQNDAHNVESQSILPDRRRSPSRGRTMSRSASPRYAARSPSRRNSRSSRRYARSSSRGPSAHPRSRSRAHSPAGTPPLRPWSKSPSRSRSRSLPSSRSRSRRPSRSPSYQAWSRSRSGSRRRSLSRQRTRSWSRSGSPARDRQDLLAPSMAPAVAATPRMSGPPRFTGGLQHNLTLRGGSVETVRLGNYNVSSRRRRVFT